MCPKSFPHNVLPCSYSSPWKTTWPLSSHPGPSFRCCLRIEAEGPHRTAPLASMFSRMPGVLSLYFWLEHWDPFFLPIDMCPFQATSSKAPPCTLVQKQLCMLLHTNRQVSTREHICAHAHTCAHMSTCTYLQYICTYMHTHAHAVCGE